MVRAAACIDRWFGRGNYKRKTGLRFCVWNGGFPKENRRNRITKERKTEAAFGS
ncbi:hypothetical protein BS78_07G060800 [Paspalum vaginatum]|nr:hypothetical protein BS78_07G060800 [Paspalum vaginatum]